jgi:hypothetical protein
MGSSGRSLIYGEQWQVEENWKYLNAENNGTKNKMVVGALEAC